MQGPEFEPKTPQKIPISFSHSIQLASYLQRFLYFSFFSPTNRLFYWVSPN